MWILTAKVTAFTMSFFLPIIIVRYLTREQVGQYREAFQVVSNAVVILPLGLSMSAYYFLSRETDRRASAVFNILLFNFVAGGLAFLCLALFPQLLGNIFKSSELERLAPLIGGVIWLWIFSTFLETAALANQEAKLATIFIAFAAFSKTLLLASAVILFSSVEAFLIAALVQGIVQSIILLVYLRSRFPRFWHCFNGSFFREQVVYALPFGLTGVLWTAQNDIHNYFVGYKFSASEFAIYAYGCFQIPLLTMLAESVTSVLIPRMNTLHMAGDKDEMIRLTTRAMQKLSFFYFPAYVFFMLTAPTFISTLFTRQYSASTSIFIINLTLLPLGIIVTDPIVRSFKELGKVILAVRLVIFAGLVTVLYLNLEQLTLTGMISVAVAAVLTERCVVETIVIRKLGLGFRHLRLLTGILKTAFASVIAGAATYVFYGQALEYLTNIAAAALGQIISAERIGVIDLVSGAFVLSVSAAVFIPIYLVLVNYLGLIDDEEKDLVVQILNRFRVGRAVGILAGTRG